MRVLGLMSGTSADGVEAVLAEFVEKPSKPKWKLLKSISFPYPSALRKRIIDTGQGLKLSSQEWLDLTESITELHSKAAKACDPQGLSELVGCHGQTVWHRPPTKDKRGASLQLLQAPLLAQLLNRPIVHDFRSADLVLGGQGAPLVPLADAAILGRLHRWRAVLNLGGIANLTLIPPSCGPERWASVLGWDCGPANTLVDLAVQKISNGVISFDRDGLIAAKGSPDERVIKRWLQEPFFQKLPPKSTGREQFGLLDLENRLRQTTPISHENFIATLTAFSAAHVAQDLDNLHKLNLVRPSELLVAGGGCRNPVMLKEIISRCRGMRVKTIDEIGIPIEAREALVFALLAWWHILQYKVNTPAVTGAKKQALLGIRVNPV